VLIIGWVISFLLVWLVLGPLAEWTTEGGTLRWLWVMAIILIIGAAADRYNSRQP
jgi:hypothetical protein